MSGTTDLPALASAFAELHAGGGRHQSVAADWHSDKDATRGSSNRDSGSLSANASSSESESEDADEDNEEILRRHPLLVFLNSEFVRIDSRKAALRGSTSLCCSLASELATAFLYFFIKVYRPEHDHNNFPSSWIPRLGDSKWFSKYAQKLLPSARRFFGIHVVFRNMRKRCADFGEPIYGKWCLGVEVDPVLLVQKAGRKKNVSLRIEAAEEINAVCADFVEEQRVLGFIRPESDGNAIVLKDVHKQWPTLGTFEMRQRSADTDSESAIFASSSSAADEDASMGSVGNLEAEEKSAKKGRKRRHHFAGSEIFTKKRLKACEEVYFDGARWDSISSSLLEEKSPSAAMQVKSVKDGRTCDSLLEYVSRIQAHVETEGFEDGAEKENGRHLTDFEEWIANHHSRFVESRDFRMTNPSLDTDEANGLRKLPFVWTEHFQCPGDAILGASLLATSPFFRRDGYLRLDERVFTNVQHLNAHIENMHENCSTQKMLASEAIRFSRSLLRHMLFLQSMRPLTKKGTQVNFRADMNNSFVFLHAASKCASQFGLGELYLRSLAEKICRDLGSEFVNELRVELKASEMDTVSHLAGIPASKQSELDPVDRVSLKEGIDDVRDLFKKILST